MRLLPPGRLSHDISSPDAYLHMSQYRHRRRYFGRRSWAMKMPRTARHSVLPRDSRSILRSARFAVLLCQRRFATPENTMPYALDIYFSPCWRSRAHFAFTEHGLFSLRLPTAGQYFSANTSSLHWRRRRILCRARWAIISRSTRVLLSERRRAEQLRPPLPAQNKPRRLLIGLTFR